MYGGGAADMKSGLAAMVLAAAALSRKGIRLRRDLVVVGPTCRTGPDRQGQPRIIQTTRCVRSMRRGGEDCDIISSLAGPMAETSCSSVVSSSGCATAPEACDCDPGIPAVRAPTKLPSEGVILFLAYAFHRLPSGTLRRPSDYLCPTMT